MTARPHRLIGCSGAMSWRSSLLHLRADRHELRHLLQCRPLPDPSARAASARAGTRRSASDPMLAPAFRNTVIAGIAVSVIATVLGFGAAYTDYRYGFLGQVRLSGAGPAAADHPGGHPRPRHADLPVEASTCSARSTRSSSAMSSSALPFAMALIRLRLSQMDPSLEAAAWNSGRVANGAPCAR